MNETSDNTPPSIEMPIQYEATLPPTDAEEAPTITQDRVMADVKDRSEPLTETCDNVGNEDEVEKTDESSPTIEDKLAAQSGSVVVERLLVGNTEATAVLCEHTAENAKPIADALKEGDIVALEALGYANKDERELAEQLSTTLLTSALPPEAAEKVLGTEIENEEFAPMVEDSRALFREMHRTDKSVVLLDVNRDDSRYALFEQSERDFASYREKLNALAPIDETRQAFHNYVQTTALMVDHRNTVIADQLQELLHDTNQQKSPPSVSIRLGVLHHQALDGLRAGQPEEARRKADEQARSAEQNRLASYAIAEARDGNLDKAGELADMTILARYVERSIKELDGKQADQLVHSLGKEKAEAAMEQLRQRLADQDTVPVVKMLKVIHTMREAYAGHLREVFPKR